MNSESIEHLSALMDGEISKDTGRFLVRRLGSDIELRATWARYHVIRDCLRHHDGNLAGDEFSNKIQQVLAEDEPVAKQHSAMATWLKPVVGVAIAASVALMAIVTVGPASDPLMAPAGELAGSPQPQPFVSPNNGLSGSPVSQQASTSSLPAMPSQKMNSYLLRHYQVAGSTGGKGFVTFVPIVVTRDSQQTDMKADTTADGSDLKDGNEQRQR